MTTARLLRFERGLTITDVAAATGLARPTVAAAERGDPVSAPTAKTLADFYDVTVSALLDIRAPRAEEPTT